MSPNHTQMPAKPFHSTESWISVADGTLHGNSEGIGPSGLLDGKNTRLSGFPPLMDFSRVRVENCPRTIARILSRGRLECTSVLCDAFLSLCIV